jgi:hypothetical protein
MALSPVPLSSCGWRVATESRIPLLPGNRTPGVRYVSIDSAGRCIVHTKHQCHYFNTEQVGEAVGL